MELFSIRIQRTFQLVSTIIFNNKHKNYEILKNYGNIYFYLKFIELRAWE